MKLILVRKHLKPSYTIGELWYKKNVMAPFTFFCSTLEDTVRAAIKIPNETAISYGTYEIIIKHSPTFKSLMPYLQNVEGFTDIMIHPGTSNTDTSGCILVGLNTVEGHLTSSTIQFKRLMSLLLLDKHNFIRITTPEESFYYL